MAAWLALTQFGEGSSPSSPTFENSEVGSGNSEVFQIKKLPTSDLQIPNSQLETHWSSSGQDFAFVMRRRGFDSHPVLLGFMPLVQREAGLKCKPVAAKNRDL